MQAYHSLRKFSGPVLPPNILYRASLVNKLNEVIVGTPPSVQEGWLHYKCVLLYAPAGYGKTTLFADFIRYTGTPCCWYILDRLDTDKMIFLENLFASIRYRFPHFGVTLSPLLAAALATDLNNPTGLHHFEYVIDALCEAIATEITERFALLLCNYHEVNESEVITHLVNRLLQKLPPQCVLVIESRAIPTLEFVPLLTRREIFGLGTDMLRFTAQEICDLARLQNAVPLSEAEAKQLVESFSGWIAGILLGTRLGDISFLHADTSLNAIEGSSIIQLDRDRQNLFTYLVNEVFNREPEMYAFLKEAVILQLMTPFHCNALLNITDAFERLQYLEHQGMFVVHRGEGTDIIYTCHPVLQELLYNTLRQQSPQHFAQLHRRAAELLHASDAYDQAIFHALEANADDLATSLIIETEEQMLAQGHAATLIRWIDTLLSTTTAPHPKLLLIRAHLHLILGEHAHGFACLDAAYKIITSPSPIIDPDDIPMSHAAIALGRSHAFFQAGKYQQAQALCHQVLTQVPVDEIALRAEAYTRLGVCANILGDFITGTAHLQKALQLWGCDTRGRQMAELHSILADTYSLIGNFALAEHHLIRAISYQDHLNDSWGKVKNLISVGLIKQRQGAFVESEAAFTQALTIARGTIHFLHGEAYALIGLGELYQDQGLYNQSLMVIEQGLALASQLADTTLMSRALCDLAMIYLFMADASTAMLLLSEMDRQTVHDETTDYEKVIRELTYGTILLYQSNFSEAYVCLLAVESSLQTMNLKREQIQTTLRIAACQLIQGQTSESIHRLQKMTIQMMRDAYEQLVLIELQRLPVLQHIVKESLEMAGLRTLLHLETEPQETGSFPSSVPTSVITTISQPRLTIHALGEPAILIGETLITHWRMAHAMELCFLLLNYGRPMRKEQIITALWPEVNERIDQTLRSTIYYLRKALGESCILSQAGTYTLNLTSLFGNNVSYDVAAFQKHYSEAKQALDAKDDPAAQTALLEMVNLYHGDYVQSFYSNWCIHRRDELRQAHLDAYQRLAQIAWRSEQFDQSVIHWQQMLVVDNCLEDAHYGLMRCYLRLGKRGLALRQYQRVCTALQDELAVLPGPAIQSLYQRLVNSS